MISDLRSELRALRHDRYRIGAYLKQQLTLREIQALVLLESSRRDTLIELWYPELADVARAHISVSLRRERGSVVV